jgi:sirohydrochlorin cobaltochelatase
MPDIFDDQEQIKALEARLVALLPTMYQDCYEEIEPVPMGSAPLKYAADGRVAWDAMWTDFCNLAMAGGPPHKGKLLEPGTMAEISSEPDRYQNVAQEICRGITMVADLPAKPSSTPGWVAVECDSATTATWLVRAISMENVSAHSEDLILNLPAGPSYRLEKEVKNVITVVAKTCHYWFSHTPTFQKKDIGRLFAKMDAESPLIQSAVFGSSDFDSRKALSDRIAEAIQQATGLATSNEKYVDWVGVECRDVQTAIWMMRAAVVSNVVSRREDKTFFVPVNPKSDPHGETVLRTVTQLYRLAAGRGMF